MTTTELKQYIDKVLGNSIRCLLPSYWWKRLFNQVADRIDEVEQSTSKLIDSKVEEVKMPIVESENALKKLDVENGSLASVATMKTMKFSECYVPTEEDNDLTDEELFAKLTPVTGIEMTFPLPDISTADTSIQLVAEGGKGEGFLTISEGFCVAVFALAGETQKYWILSSQTMVDGLNEYLSQQRWYFLDSPEEVGAENMALFDQIFTIVDCTSDVYVKGNTWERLAKESDLEGIEGGGGGGSGEIKEEVNALKEQVDALNEKSKVVRVYANIGKEGSLDNVMLPAEYQERNKEIYERVANGEVLFADIYGGLDYVESIYYTSTRYYTALKGTLVNNAIVFRVEDSGLYDSWLRHIEINASGYATIHDEYIINKTPVGKSVIIDMSNFVTKEELNNKADKSQIPTKLSQLEKDIEIGSNITVDSELSETSENPVQNKVLTAELAKRKNIIVEHYKSYKVEEFLNSLDVKKQHPTSAYPPPSYCLESKDLYDEEFEDIFGDWLKNLGEKFYTSEVVLDDSSHTDIAVVKPWFFYDKDYYGVVFDYPYSRAVEGVGYDTAEIRIEFDNDTSRKYIVSVNLKNAYSKTRIINLSDVPENDTKYIKQLEGHVKDYGFEYQYYGIINNDYITTMIPLSVTYDKNYGAPYIYISGSYFFRDSASTLKKHNIIYRLSTAAVTVGPIFNDLSYIDEVIENTAYKTYVDNAIANLTNEIITNEEVIAAALNDLNKRLKLLENVE